MRLFANDFRKRLPKLWTDQAGAALVDYALIASLFSLALIASLGLITHVSGNNLNRTTNSLTNMSYSP
jgi:Flp pilus assembly pilin Flp